MLQNEPEQHAARSSWDSRSARIRTVSLAVSIFVVLCVVAVVSQRGEVHIGKKAAVQTVQGPALVECGSYSNDGVHWFTNFNELKQIIDQYGCSGGIAARAALPVATVGVSIPKSCTESSHGSGTKITIEFEYANPSPPYVSIFELASDNSLIRCCYHFDTSTQQCVHNTCLGGTWPFTSDHGLGIIVRPNWPSPSYHPLVQGDYDKRSGMVKNGYCPSIQIHGTDSHGVATTTDFTHSWCTWTQNGLLLNSNTVTSESPFKVEYINLHFHTPGSLPSTSPMFPFTCQANLGSHLAHAVVHTPNSILPVNWKCEWESFKVLY